MEQKTKNTPTEGAGDSPNRTNKSGMQRNFYILPACIRPKLP